MSCVEAILCPWCPISAQHNRLTRGVPGVDCACCMMMCIADSCFTCGFMTLCSNMRQRSEIQRRYGLVVDDCENCLATCFCLSCAITQQYREMCYRSAYPGGLCVSPPVGTPMGFPVPVPASPQLVIVQHVVAQPQPVHYVAAPMPPPPYNNGYPAAGYPQQPPYQPQPAYGYAQPAPAPVYGQPLQPAPQPNYYNNGYAPYSPRAVETEQPPFDQNNKNQTGYAD